MAAAIRLREKGHEPLVLERSDAPGGRVRTDEVDGFLLDRGFQILLTAYPQAQAMLDYDALDLRPFEPGAIVRVDDRFHRVSDPFRSPASALGTLRAPVGSLRDKRAVLTFRHKVRRRGRRPLLPEGDHRRPTPSRAGFSEKMIDRFLRPLFAAGVARPSLEFSSRSLEFLFRMFADGEAAIPARGMGAISEQLAARLPAGAIRCEASVTETGDHHVLVDGERVEARAIIIATDAIDAARLTGGEVVDRGTLPATTWWFAAPESPVDRPMIVLDGTRDSVVNNLAVLTEAARVTAPTVGRSWRCPRRASTSANPPCGPGSASGTAPSCRPGRRSARTASSGRNPASSSARSPIRACAWPPDASSRATTASTRRSTGRSRRAAGRPTPWSPGSAATAEAAGSCGRAGNRPAGRRRPRHARKSP
ncbi:MAG: FAD-dependent oxidoreductase [Acidimicrobiales bacterium]